LIKATFTKAKNWIRELQRQAPPHIVIALVGNKIDLCESISSSSAEQQQHQEEEGGQQESTLNDQQLQFADHVEHQDREVSKEEASHYAAECALLFLETSARLNINVDKVFTEIGNKRRVL
jgi:GTPase SAR1 family protein